MQGTAAHESHDPVRFEVMVQDVQAILIVGYWILIEIAKSFEWTPFSGSNVTDLLLFNSFFCLLVFNISGPVACEACVFPCK